MASSDFTIKELNKSGKEKRLDENIKSWERYEVVLKKGVLSEVTRKTINLRRPGKIIQKRSEVDFTRHRLQ